MAHVTKERKWLFALPAIGVLVGILWLALEPFWETVKLFSPLVLVALVIGLSLLGKVKEQAEKLGLTQALRAIAIIVGLLGFYWWLGWLGYTRLGWLTGFLEMTKLETGLIAVLVGLVLFPLPSVILSLFKPAGIPVSPESIAKGVRAVGVVIAIFLVIRGFSAKGWPGQSQLLGAATSGWTNPTLLVQGDFPNQIEPRFMESDCQRPPDGATDARLPNSQKEKSISTRVDDHWLVYWTGDEVEGYPLITSEMRQHIRSRDPTATKVRARLEVFGGPQNHFDIRNVEFTTNTSREWRHETVSLDQSRSYHPQTGYWYCDSPPSGGYPNPQLMSYMGPGQSALVLGSLTNPDAVRTLHEIVREQNGVVEFTIDLNEQAHLYFMHWSHEYVGWFGHQVRFKLFLSPYE